MTLDALTSEEGVTVGVDCEKGLGVDGCGEDVLIEVNVRVGVAGWLVAGRQLVNRIKSVIPMIW